MHERCALVVTNCGVIPAEAKRRAGIHAGAFPKVFQAWVPGLPPVARDDIDVLAGHWLHPAPFGDE